MNADDSISMGSGITLRMYLIAHAPEEPQEWFTPAGEPWTLEEREMQRYIQWPGAWADRQIELENARDKT